MNVMRKDAAFVIHLYSNPWLELSSVVFLYLFSYYFRYPAMYLK